MRSLFALGNQYLKECDWKDLALVKFCLWAMGMLIGMQVPAKNKKAVAWGAACVFIATYIPLMAKFYHVAKNVGAPRNEDAET